MRKDTYRVPRNDEEVLIEPPLGELPGIIERNSQRLRNVDIRVNGRSFQELRAQTREATILSDIDAELDALKTKLAKARQIKQGMMHNLLTVRIRLV